MNSPFRVLEMGSDEVLKVSAPPQSRRPMLSRTSGISLVECMVAVAVLGISFIGLMSGISYMRMENRAASQRMLVASEAAQILEMFKALPYAAITNSTAGTPIYLEGYGTASPDTVWYVPQSGQWQTLPVENVSSSTAGYPSVIANKIPNGVWSATITSPASPTGLKQITITINWELYAGSTRPPESYTISTVVCSAFPNI